MAETAKIINPDKKVIIPDLDASCSLAESCHPKDFKKLRDQYPDHKVITYINCSAEIKAMSDIVCTSSNANETPEVNVSEKIRERAAVPIKRMLALSK